MTNAARQLSETLRGDRMLSRQLYQAGYGTVVTIVGTLVFFTRTYPAPIELWCGGIVMAIGLVLIVLAIIRGIRLIRAKQLVVVAWVTMAIAIIAPAAVFIALATR